MADQTSPIQQIQSATNVATRLNENFDAASPAMLYGRNAATTAGLTWGYIGGRFGSALIANGTVTLTASSTNHVVAARADGVVTSLAATTNWDDLTDYIRLYKVTAGASSVTGYEDHRQAIGGTGGGGAIVAADITDSTTVGRAVMTAVDALAARTAMGAGTSNFSGDYDDLSGAPTLGTAAALNVAASGNAAAGEVVKGDDTRLTASLTNPMTTEGDLIVGGAAGAPTRLGISTNGYVLTLASGVPAWAAPSGGGGGGLTGFTSALDTASPNDTYNVSSIIASGGTADQDAVYGAKGNGAFLAQVPDNTTAGGNRRGARAVDFQRVRDSAADVASGTDAVILAGYGNRVTGSESAVITGYNNLVSNYRSGIFIGQDCTVSSSDSAIVSGINNSVSGPSGGILCGNQNSVTASRAVIVGGSTNTAAGQQSFVGAGYGNTAAGQQSFVGAGYGNTASGIGAFIVGGTDGTTRGHVGAGAHASGKFAIQGDAQAETLVLRTVTTDATTTALTADGGTYLPDRQVGLPDNSFYEFEASVSARQNTTGDGAAFRIVGAIKRGAGAGTTVIVGTPTVTSVGATAGAATWAAVAAADTSNGALIINVTGEASKSIKWVARVQTVEVVG